MKLIAIALLAATLMLSAWNISLEVRMEGLIENQARLDATNSTIAEILDKHNKNLSDLAEASIKNSDSIKSNAESMEMTVHSVRTLVHALGGEK